MADPIDDFDPQLDDRIAELRTILSLVQHSGPVLVQTSIDLIGLLRQRADRDDDDDAVNEAIQVARHALAALPPEGDYRIGVLLEYALTLELRFDRGRDQVDLDQAIGIWRDLTGPGLPVPPSSVAVATAQLGYLLRLRLSLLVNEADDDTVAAALDEAQRTLQAARDALPDNAPNLAETCWLLGLCWGDRYEADREPRHLDAAIAEIGESLRLSPDPTGDRSLALARARHERAATVWVAAGNQMTVDVQADLVAATALVRDALQVIDPEDPLYVDVLWEATAIGVTALDASPDRVDLAELAALTDRLGAHYNAIDPERTSAAAQAVVAVRARVLGAVAGADPAAGPADVVGAVREALRLMDGQESFSAPDLAEHPRMAMMLRPDLAAAKFEELARRWRESPPGPDRAVAGGLAAVVHMALHQRGLTDLDTPTAIAMATDALTARRDDETWQAQLALVLGNLLALHAHVAEPAVVAQSIEVLQSIRTSDPETQLGISAGLATALYVRAINTHQIADLQAALAGTERLLSSTTPDDPLYPSYQAQLGALLVSLGNARAEEATMRRGVALLRECADALPTQDARRSGVLANLAMGEMALLRSGTASAEDVARVMALVETADGTASRTPALATQLELLRAMPGLLTEDVAGIGEALDGLRRLGPNPGVRERMAVGGLLAARAEARRDYTEADAAVRELEPAVADLGGDFRHPLWSVGTLGLGQAYRTRAALAAPGVDRDEDRARSRRQGLLALRGHAWRALVQSNTDSAVASARDAATTALHVAGWCVQDRAAAEAAAALDAGRGLILHAASVSPMFGATSVDPRIAAADSRSRRLWALLGESGDAAAPLLDPPLIDDVRRALRSMRAHALVYLVRQYDDVPPAAVVVPHEGEPTIVDLPTGGSAPPDFLTALADNDHRAARDADITGHRPLPASGLHKVLPSLAHWAWQAAMDAVLRHCREAGFLRPYRLVLIPMGELAVVPWHAARAPSGRYALQDAVISYAASARLFCDVVNRSRIPIGQGGSLIVGDPTGDLRAAGEEVRAIREMFYPDARVLGGAGTGASATPGAVLDWLAATVDDPRGLLHLACHGVVEMSSAGSSRLVLAGGADLWAEQLVESPAWKAGACQLGLACLAACSTGVTARTYDEAFSLATAFQVAGARSVISSLWRVPDESTSLLMYLLHHYLVVDGVRPAEALRLAQLWMIDPGRRIPPDMPAPLASWPDLLDPDQLAAWAGFVHLGQW